MQVPLRVVLVVAALLASPAASLAQLRVITSGGFSAAYREALPEFERTTGITVETTSGASQGSGPNTIGAQLRRGVPADVVIMSKEGLTDLIAEGRIVPGTNVDLAQAPIGLAVRAGAPRPDISTVAAFTETLRRARSVTFTSSTTGIYLTTTLFPKLGIADDMARKSTTTGAAAVARGEAELALQPVSELLPAAGVELVGPIPETIQYISVFSAAVVATSTSLEASKRLIAFLTSERATPAIRKSGMARVKPQ